MTMPGLGTQTIIGEAMYMSVDGRSMKVPLPAGTLTPWRDPARLDENAATMTVQATGRDSVAGPPPRTYLVRNSKTQPSAVPTRSAERRLGKDGVSTGRTRG